MNDIIKVNYDSGKPLVSGWELHLVTKMGTDMTTHTTTTHDTPGTISRDKSCRIAALVVDYFKNDDNRRAFEQWRGERRRTNRHELHEEPALEVSQAR
jgi:hypothetical protein